MTTFRIVTKRDYIELCNETRPESRAFISNAEVMVLYKRIDALEVRNHNLEVAMGNASRCIQDAHDNVERAITEPNPFTWEALMKNASHWANEAVKFLRPSQLTQSSSPQKAISIQEELDRR